jgi:SEC-C motif-containing protein
MRSRYTAYVRGDFDYLLKTWHPEERDKHVDFGAQEGIRWQGLEIIDTENGDDTDTEGIVEFKVYFQRNELARVLHEKSRFIKEEDNWYYVDGDVLPTEPARSLKVGRNKPCPCGSGKKYKKCCLTS